MRTVLSTVMALALGASVSPVAKDAVTHAAKPIAVEAEGLRFPRAGGLILAYRRGGSICPTLYDGHGKPVATFPFPSF